MIAGLCLFAYQLAANSGFVLTNVERSAGEVSIALVARLPKLSYRETAALRDLVERLPGEVDGISHHDAMLTTNGDRIRAFQGADFLAVYFSVAPSNWRSGLNLMAAIAHDSKLLEPTRTSTEAPDAWTVALNPIDPPKTVRQEEVEALYRKLFRPDNLYLGVGGPVDSDKVETDWRGRLATWVVPRVPLPARFVEPPRMLTKNTGGLDSIDLEGPEILPGDAGLPTKLLALFALGSGKGACLFRVARQELQLSYRQEALLYPTPSGWESRILLVTAPAPDLAGRADLLRTALLHDIKGWTDVQRERALGMAMAVLQRDVEFSPIGLGPNGAINNTLAGRTFLKLYWQVKMGRPWDAGALVEEMKNVPTDDLKLAATDMIIKAQLRLLPAG